MRKLTTFTATVLLLHLLALWVLQNGLLQRRMGVAQPMLVVTLQTASAKPLAVAPAPLPLARAPKAVTPVPVNPPLARAEPVTSAQPSSVAAANPLPSAATTAAQHSGNATLVSAPASTTGSTTGPSGAAATASSAPPPDVELPSSDAQHLHNPKPNYPRASRQRGEQGRVVVHVLIGTDGTAQKAEIKVSSGFERLDQAALTTVKAWRYVPGKRGGVPEAMWYLVPLNFVME
jgi:protein TonB